MAKKGVYGVSVECVCPNDGKVSRGQGCVCVLAVPPDCVMITCLRQQMDFQFSVNSMVPSSHRATADM